MKFGIMTLRIETLSIMGLYHLLDGVTNCKYKLLYFLTPNKKYSKRKALAFKQDRCCHLAICLRLILFHYTKFTMLTDEFCNAVCHFLKRQISRIVSEKNSEAKKLFLPSLCKTITECLK